MRVVFQGCDAIIIEPETEFESEWLRSFKIDKTFHKTGLSPSDYIGLKITRKQTTPDQENKNQQES